MNAAAMPLAALALLAVPAPAAAADGDPLFQSQDPVTIRIAAPLRDMARDRAEDPDYRDGTLTLVDAAGAVAAGAKDAARTFSIRIRPRGHSRRDREVCLFPPLRVDFRKSELNGTLFDGQNVLKLVTHCRSGDRSLSYLYKEFLAYRMLNQVTDAAFRVRPLSVEYVDSERGGDADTHFGFFIEHKKRLAKRLGLETAEPQRIDRAELDPDASSLMDLFQFMIGNTDYSFLAGPEGEACCHNATLLQNAQGQYLPLPYDFDITGFVDAPYAVVDKQLPIRNVRKRLYRGICRDDGSIENAVAQFQSARPRVLETVQNETPLDGRERRVAVEYIESFYAVLDDPKAFQRQVLDICRR